MTTSGASPTAWPTPPSPWASSSDRFESAVAAFRTLDEADLRGKRVLLRVDLNVRMDDGKVSDLTRLERAAPTITEIADKGGKVILLSHFGRPKGRDLKDSLKPVADALARVLNRPVGFAQDCIGPAAEAAVDAMKNGDIVCLENTRFHRGEENNDPAFTEALAALGDIWVNDAFSAAHRAHASTEGLGHKLPAYAGRTMQAELEALDKALGKPKKPVIAIVGGAKVSTKLELLENLVTRVDALVIGGGGDTVAALNQAGVAAKFTYVSTAGGAFLEWMEGKPLPGVEVLKQ